MIITFMMVGAFPPPVHGMAVVNAAVRDALRQAGVTPLVIDIAAHSIDRSLVARLRRLPRVLQALGRLVGQRGLRGATLYMSVSGGFGQFYEIAFLLVARLCGMRMFLHHHSFAYLDKLSILSRVLMYTAGDDAVHILLSSAMAERLQQMYGVMQVMPISNTVFFTIAEVSGKVRSQLATVGFLGNISPDKGVFEFLDLMAAAGAAGLRLHAKLAGPFKDIKTERAVRARLDALPQVEYMGPQYGAAKDAFYDRIDVLVFPTRYINEAEPITVHEVMSRAIPVIAYGRGCIPEIIGVDCGLVVDPALPFVPAALAQLESWLTNPTVFQAASNAAIARFSRTREESMARWCELLRKLVMKDRSSVSIQREKS